MKKPPLSEEHQKLHNDAVAKGLYWYRDPETQYIVFTELYHKKRGRCCGSRCRHCAFDWMNVGFTPKSLSVLMVVLLAASLLLPSKVFAQRVCIDTVLKFTKGDGQEVGQGPAFFPMNIFGIPDPTANDTVPSIDPRQICSIGLGGSIIVGNTTHVVVDNPGADFIIYENVFRYTNGKRYIEPASVEVSKNGIDWVLFPYNSTTYQGCAGMIPTTGRNPFDVEVSGGDPFDLADISIDSIRWIRITDITERILLNPSSPFYDPTKTGFDLDAICYVHAARVAFYESIIITPNSRNCTVQCTEPAIFYVYDVYGRLYDQQNLSAGVHTISSNSWMPGAYITVLQTSSTVVSNRVLR